MTRASCVPAFTTSDARAAAFTALGATRITFLTPYNDAVHAREIAFLASLGLKVSADDNLGLETTAEMARLTPDEQLA